MTLADGNLIVFDYPAKGGKRRLQAIVDPQVHRVVAELKGRRAGPQLLAYRNTRWVDIRSDDINEYVKETTGGDFSAKDFRTWHATVLAAVALAVSGEATSQASRKRAITRAVQEVAHYLGNTPAVARASYIDPRVFDLYQDGVTIAPALGRLDDVELGAPENAREDREGRSRAARLGSSLSANRSVEAPHEAGRANPRGRA